MSQRQPPVFAYYYNWWVPGSWGDTTDMPSLGHYDSGDDSILETHMDWAKNHGIDGWFISYSGDDAWNRDRLERVVAKARKKNFKLGIMTEWTRYGVEPYEPAQIEAMKNELRHLIDTYGDDPVFKWTPDGRMPIFIYVTYGVGGNTCTDLISTMRAEGRDAFFMLDAIPDQVNFDWWLDTVGFNGVMYYTARLSRWDGIWEQQKTNIRRHPDKLWGLPAAPGFDNTHNNPAGWIADRANGQYYRNFLDRVLSLEPDFIVINSWNEWFENSQIEPGTGSHMGDDPMFYLEITKEYFGPAPVSPTITLESIAVGTAIGLATLPLTKNPLLSAALALTGFTADILIRRAGKEEEEAFDFLY